MKANNGSGDHEGRDGWQTPQWLFNQLQEQYYFNFDCCAQKNNTKCEWFSNDFLTVQEVQGVAWMNPPFSKAKEMFSHFFKVVKHGVFIYRCDNPETQLWQKEIFPHVDWVFYFEGRVEYEGQEGKGARFCSALGGVGVPPPVGLDGYAVKVIRDE